MNQKQQSVVLCGIAKDEDRYLNEWVLYHISIGFDKIIIYDNESKIPISHILSNNKHVDKVTVVHWPTLQGINSQDTAYDHFLNYNRHEFDWAAILDLDEFLNIKIHANVQDFLKSFDNPTSIGINWRIFGSSGEALYRDDPIRERFQRASEIGFHPNGVIKSIYNLSKTKSIFQHHGEPLSDPDTRSASNRSIENHHFIYSNPEDFAVAQVNHYFVKSLEEWKWKNSRGYTDHTIRSPGMFEEYDRNELIETSILRWNAT